MSKQSDYYKKLGENLSLIRKKKGFTQEQLSYAADVERAKISKIENGNEDFYFSTLFRLAEALEINLKDILDF